MQYSDKASSDSGLCKGEAGDSIAIEVKIAGASKFRSVVKRRGVIMAQQDEGRWGCRVRSEKGRVQGLVWR